MHALLGALLAGALLAAPAALALGPEEGGPPAPPGIGDLRPGAPAESRYLPALPSAPESVVAADLTRTATLADQRVWGGFSDRRIKAIHYAAAFRVNQSEMRLNFDAPGAGRAIVSLELEF